MRILIIEDDEKIGSFIQKGFKEDGYFPDWVKDGGEAFVLLQDKTYDLLIVDRMIPTLDGVSLIKKLRQANISTPALILSALNGIEDRVDGLDGGADAYLGKPFAFSELRATARALLKRSSKKVDDSIKIADLLISIDKFVAKRNDKTLDLTPKEFQLLVLLARNQDKVVTRTAILEALWGIYYETDTNLVDVHIRRLRSKVDDGFSLQLIKTVRGVGYKLSGLPE